MLSPSSPSKKMLSPSKLGPLLGAVMKGCYFECFLHWNGWTWIPGMKFAHIDYIDKIWPAFQMPWGILDLSLKLTVRIGILGALCQPLAIGRWEMVVGRRYWVLSGDGSKDLLWLNNFWRSNMLLWRGMTVYGIIMKSRQIHDYAIHS